MADQPKNNPTNIKGLKMTPPRKASIAIMIATAVIVIGLLWLFSAMHPLPPRVITMATGPEGSSYAYFGKRYKLLLAKYGIELRLVPTVGGVENLKLLRDPRSGVQLGFVEGGVAKEDDDQALDSLGTVGYEPVFFFSHKLGTDRILYAMQGKKVAVGPEGSDSRALVEELLHRNSLDSKMFQAIPLEPENAAEQLIQGKVDAAIIMQSWGSPIVTRLINAPGIDLANFARADAYVAIFPSVYKLVLPQGVGNLKTQQTPQGHHPSGHQDQLDRQERPPSGPSIFVA